MFPINEAKNIDSDYPIIVGNYQVLHFDEEPILYCGTNRFGNRIVGSLVEDNEENRVSRHFRVVVDSKIYNSFITQQKSYLEVLKDSREIYVVDNKYDGQVLQIFHLDVKDIPAEYLPLAEAYCPLQIYQSTFSYLVRLVGQLADRNAAMPRVISKIQNKFADILETVADQMKPLGFDGAEAVQLPYENGSFVMNFDVNLSGAKSLFLNEKDVADYLKRFIEYCIRHLPDEVEMVYGNVSENPEKFNQLLDCFEDAYSKSGKNLPDNYSQKIKDEIKKTAESFVEISENIGDHFSGIEILNEKTEKNVIGFLDIDFKQIIESMVLDIQQRISKVEKDEVAKGYKIYIYHLNVKSRTGNAFIYNDPEETSMSQPRITISSEEPLEGSKYTKSLHATEWINVQAKAVKTDGKFRTLEIEFEVE